MKKTILALSLSLVLLAALLAGCGGSASPAPAASAVSEPSSAADASATDSPAATSPAASTTGETVKLVVGASPSPHAEILELVVPTLAEQGIELEIQEFNDYILPNVAVTDGSLDANYFQHQPYLDDYNEENGTDLVSAGSIHIEPLGIYPGKVATLEELADGATIAVPNDATNEGRALLLLESLDLIELDPEAGLKAVPSDITANPRNLQFVELEAAQLPVTLPDVDFAVINGNYAVGAGIGDTVLATEAPDSPYVNVVAVRNGDEARPEIQALVAALQSEEVAKFMEENYNGIVVPAF